MRTYELVIVADPRLTDEEMVAMTEDYKKMITSGGAEVTKEESWGRRKLAYPIAKLNEARYVLLGVSTDGKSPLPEVELRLRQNDKVLRYLTVRTDRNGKPIPPPQPREERGPMGPGGGTGGGRDFSGPSRAEHGEEN
jgi:small subunit ribosomal protein S6